MHENITYNPLQKLTYSHLREDCNLVVLAPTSSGKTIVAEQYIFDVLDAGKKAIYLSPLKALTTEKYNIWKQLPYKTSVITSDYASKKIEGNLILMTTESLDSKTRGVKSWMSSVGVIVSDESHLLSTEGRGDAFEIGLVRFSEINSSAKIIFLSATIPNTKELSEWLTTLNGKPTKIVETDWRPVEQEFHLVQASNSTYEFNEDVISKVKSIRSSDRESQILIFVHSFNSGYQISNALACPFHNSKHTKSQRNQIEVDFSKKTNKILVSTSTLAYGINLPADVGVIAGAHRGLSDVDIVDLRQMAGRIGRYGLSEKGIVHFVFKQVHAKEKFQQINKIPDVRSVLDTRLYFHLTSFVAREGRQREEIQKFLERTLAHKQYTLEVDKEVDLLISYNILGYDNEGKLIATSLGRASALMYVDPIDLYYVRRNLSALPSDPTSIAKGFTKIPSLAFEVYIPRELDNPINLDYGKQIIMGTCLRDWMRGKELKGSMRIEISQFLYDIERWISALKIAGLNKDYIEAIQIMVENGVPDHLIGLAKLKGIGRKRALSLYNHNIKTPEQILENERVSKNILGARIFEDVYNQIKGDSIILRF